MSATLMRTEDGPASADNSVNRAFDGLGATRDFFKEVFDRDSLDDQGMPLRGYVHYGNKYDNAFFDGTEMVFGDGDGVIFSDLTGSLDVIAHELTHGVTQFTAGLRYHKQSGALNESVSDVFGSLVKQWSLGQTADMADWLIGVDVWSPTISGDALRSMKAPGTAYNDPLIGKDPQPDHMDGYLDLPDTPEGDNGGVHENSGIPNKAFYLCATAIGGFAWEKAGLIWYESLKASNEFTNFQEFADTTYLQAALRFGTGSDEQQAIADAWRQVGVRVSGTLAGSRGRGGGRWRVMTPQLSQDDSLASLTKQLDAISSQVTSLAKDLKGRRDKR